MNNKNRILLVSVQGKDKCFQIRWKQDFTDLEIKFRITQKMISCLKTKAIEVLCTVGSE